MGLLDDKGLLYKVAREYYVENLSQNEISTKNHISRSLVSKLLTNARSEGIVKIEVLSPDELKTHELSHLLAERMHLNCVYIFSHGDESIFFNSVSNFITRYIADFKRVGLGWGPAMYKIAKSLSYANPSQTRKIFVPLVNSTRTQVPFWKTNVIASIFAEKFYSTTFLLDTFDFNRRDLIYYQERVFEITRQWEQLDTAIVGLGGKELRDRVILRELADENLIGERRSNLIGDLLTHFFLEDGRIYEPSSDDTHFSCPLDIFCNIPNRLLIAYGEEKIDATCFIVKHQLVTHLVTDEMTAKALLSRF